jgi:hypothetical protein
MVVKSALVTGNGTVQTLAQYMGGIPLPAPSPYLAKWLRLSAPSGNAQSVFYGGAEILPGGSPATVDGFPLAKGTSQDLLVNGADVNSLYDMNLIYVYVANGDTLNVLYAQG